MTLVPWEKSHHFQQVCGTKMGKLRLTYTNKKRKEGGNYFKVLALYVGVCIFTGGVVNAINGAKTTVTIIQVD